MAYPTLNQNKIFAALYNQIISIDTFADNIKGTYSTLVDKARVDGGLYGDTKVYISTDVLKSAPWGNDAEATNLLALHRPPAPKTQTITLDLFRQICLTVDQYLTKQAFATEGAFSQFNSAILAWIRDTKKIYDSTTYNTFIGNTASSTGRQSLSIGISTIRGNASSEEEANRLEAQGIAQFLADLFVDMEDVSRDFNDNEFLRSVSEEDIKVIWNSKFVNKIRKIDLPTIFHKDGLLDKFDEKVLPARYFGTVITSSNISTYSASTPTTGKPINSTTHAYTPGTNHANGCLRSLYEVDVTVSGTAYHVFPGDEIPSGATVGASQQFDVDTVYIETTDVICKVLVKLPPYMSAFEVGTSFFNPKSLTENHYLTFGHNTIEYLKNYPFITIKADR